MFENALQLQNASQSQGPLLEQQSRRSHHLCGDFRRTSQRLAWQVMLAAPKSRSRLEAFKKGTAVRSPNDRPNSVSTINVWSPFLNYSEFLCCLGQRCWGNLKKNTPCCLVKGFQHDSPSSLNFWKLSSGFQGRVGRIHVGFPMFVKRSPYTKLGATLSLQR